MWFIDALDGEFDDNADVQLPLGADRDYVWRVDNLAKVQANLTARNIVTASFLSNYYHDEYDGLGFLVPQPATPIELETAYFGSLKDQYYFRNGALLETGFGVDQYDTTLTPREIVHTSSCSSRPRATITCTRRRSPADGKVYRTSTFHRINGMDGTTLKSALT
jgi:hypothetical protein